MINLSVRPAKILFVCVLAGVCPVVFGQPKDGEVKQRADAGRFVQIRLEISKDGKWTVDVGGKDGAISDAEKVAKAVAGLLEERKAAARQGTRIEIVIFNDGAGAEQESKVCAPIIDALKKLGTVETRKATIADVQELSKPPRISPRDEPAENNDIAVGFGGTKVGPAVPQVEDRKLLPFGIPGNVGGIGPKVWFGGVQANAMRIVVVCDMSKGVTDIDRIRQGERIFFDGLKTIQSFNLINYQDGKALPLDAKNLLLATPEHKRMAYDFLDKAATKGSGDPTAALKMAFATTPAPQLVYFASTGDWKDGEAIAKLIRELNKDNKVHVCTIGLTKEPKETDKLLQRIARENGGEFGRFSLPDDDAKK